MSNALFEHIQKFTGLSEADRDIIAPYLRHVKVEKKDYLLQPGQVCTASHFIVRGCFRAFIINKKGNEQILQFGIENWWITDYESLDHQIPSRFYIQATEDAEVVSLDKAIEEELFGKVPRLERYFRIILQKAYAASQRRIQFIYCLSGEERYIQFSTAYPDFVQRVPQFMLASYLGFTPEFLSKIRAKKS